MKNPKSIRALFAFPGFNASSKLVGKFGDRYARVIQLKRRKNSHLWSLWSALPRALRQEGAAGTRPVGCGMANLPGVRTLACQMSEVLRRACRTS